MKKVKASFRVRLPDHIEEVDYTSIAAVPGITWKGAFFFCLRPGEPLMSAPVNIDGSISLTEASPVEIWAVEEKEKDKIREIAKRLKCALL